MWGRKDKQECTDVKSKGSSRKNRREMEGGCLIEKKLIVLTKTRVWGKRLWRGQ